MVMRSNPASSLQNQQSGSDDAFYMLLTIFISCLVIAQLLATKLIAIAIPYSGSLVFPGGVIAYAITYWCTDVISEVWGRTKASFTVFCGLIANLAILLLIQVTRLLPAQPGWELTSAFDQVSGMITRVTVASVVAYILSQYHDVWLFHQLKRMSKDRLLWLRNTASTSISQIIDTIIFILIAFYGKMPMSGIIALVIGQSIVKLMIAVSDTPFVYLAVWILKKKGAKPGTGNMTDCPDINGVN